MESSRIVIKRKYEKHFLETLDEANAEVESAYKVVIIKIKAYIKENKIEYQEYSHCHMKDKCLSLHELMTKTFYVELNREFYTGRYWVYFAGHDYGTTMWLRRLIQTKLLLDHICHRQPEEGIENHFRNAQIYYSSITRPY